MDGFLGFEPVACDAEDNALVTGNFSAVDELAGAGDCHASSCLGKNASVFGEVADAANHFFIRAILGTSACLVHAANGIVAVRRSANGEGFHDCVRF